MRSFCCSPVTQDEAGGGNYAAVYYTPLNGTAIYNLTTPPYYTPELFDKGLVLKLEPLSISLFLTFILTSIDVITYSAIALQKYLHPRFSALPTRITAEVQTLFPVVYLNKTHPQS